MDRSRCPRCPGRNFEVVAGEPANSRVMLRLVRCAACGTVVGALDFYSPALFAEQQQRVVADLAAQVAELAAAVRRLEEPPTPRPPTR